MKSRKTTRSSPKSTTQPFANDPVRTTTKLIAQSPHVAAALAGPSFILTALIDFMVIQQALTHDMISPN
jgi:hypothetical protein